ncbi:hypothetical protein B566_EDAN000963 [Ephemera danica]|nr:hypothetical protein B566_EDAN000963 [Ephemera danica]
MQAYMLPGPEVFHLPNMATEPQLRIERPAFSQDGLHDVSNYAKPRINRIKQYFSEVASQCRPMKMIRGVCPLFDWLPQYNWKIDFPCDVIAGVTVAIMHIPQGLGYALLGNVPAVVGIYMAFFPQIPYFIFGTSRHNSMGTFAVITILVGRAVAAYSQNPQYTHDVYTTVNGTTTIIPVMYTNLEVGTSLTLLVSFWHFIFYACRMGIICTLLSDALVNSFICGAGFHIFTSQIKEVFGVKTNKHVGPLQLINTYIDIGTKVVYSKRPETIYACLIITAVCVTILVINVYLLKPFLEKYTKIPFPTELVIIVAGVFIAEHLELYKTYGVPPIGFIPKGIPAPSFPYLNLIQQLLLDSFITAIVAYAVSMSMALILAEGENYEVDPNQEFLAHSVLASIIIVALKKILIQVTDFPGFWRKSTMDGIVWLAMQINGIKIIHYRGALNFATREHLKVEIMKLTDIDPKKELRRKKRQEKKNKKLEKQALEPSTSTANMSNDGITNIAFVGEHTPASTHKKVRPVYEKIKKCGYLEGEEPMRLFPTIHDAVHHAQIALQNMRILSELHIASRTSAEANLRMERPAYSQDDFNDISEYVRPQINKLKHFCHEKMNTCRPTKIIRQLFPVFDWIPQYNWKTDFPSDVIAGVTVAIMHVPQGTFAVIELMVGRSVMQYANNPQYTHAVNMTVNGSLSLVYVTYTPIEVGTALTLLASFWQLLFYVFRMGIICTLLSDTLVNSFVCASGFHILTSQLKEVFGIRPKKFTGPLQLIYTYINMGEILMDNSAEAWTTTYACLIITVVCVTILLLNTYVIKPFLQKYTSIPFPLELLLVVAGVLIAEKFDFSRRYHVPEIGKVSKGIPGPVFPYFDLTKELLVNSFVTSVVAYAISMSMAFILAEVADMPKFWRKSKMDGIVWLVVFLSVIVIDIDYGLGIGFLLSAGLIFIYGLKAYTCLLGNIPNTDLYLDINRYKAAIQVEGVKIMHYRGALYFATRQHLKQEIIRLTGIDPQKEKRRRKRIERRIRQNAAGAAENGAGAAENGTVKNIILDFSALSSIDPAGACQVKKIAVEYADIDITVTIAGCSGPVYEKIKKCGYLEGDRALRLYPTIHDAVHHTRNAHQNQVYVTNLHSSHLAGATL